MKHSKETDGHNLYFTNAEVRNLGKALGYVGAGLVLIRLLRYMVKR